MEVFSYLPGGPETIEAFNARVKEFCLDAADTNPVIGVTQSGVGPALFLSLAQAEDTLPMGIIAYPVAVELPHGILGNLEAFIGDEIEKIQAEHTDAEERIPLEVRFVTNPAGLGYAIIIVNIGMLDVGDEPDT